MDCESDESERWEDFFGKQNRPLRIGINKITKDTFNK